MHEQKTNLFIAFRIQQVARIKEIRFLHSKQEADVYGLEETSYEGDDPQHWDEYDPPVVVLFEVPDHAAQTLTSGKFTRPYAIYQRGEKWACVRVDAAPQED